MVRISRFVIIGIVALSGTCWSGCNCRRGDFTKYLSQEQRDFYRQFEGNWLADAEACRVGAYMAIAPVDGVNPRLILSRGEKAAILLDAGSATIFSNGKLVAQLLDRDNDGQFDSISYEAFDKRTNRNISIADHDLDGQADWRSSWAHDGPLRSELWVHDQWNEMVKKDDHYGVMRDGVFVPMGDVKKLRSM